jgi:hypothetical protein
MNLINTLEVLIVSDVALVLSYTREKLGAVLCIKK